jgi:DNA (cytosine-5)-methyltransferase 1
LGKAVFMLMDRVTCGGCQEGWTKYGADGREICSTNRYAALGNAIALPCAKYIMAGIAEVLGK